VNQTDSKLRQRVLDYLRGHNVMTLATSGPDGLWAAAVFYVNDNLDLYFLSSSKSRHGVNIAANPRIAATIQEDYKAWPEIKGIQLEGAVFKLDRLEQAAAITRYGMKFPMVANLTQAPPEIARAFSKVSWYKVVPELFYFIDNSRGFGHRDQVTCGEDKDAAR
jgi:uncharacterized protein YhbP (UPF0306 family)